MNNFIRLTKTNGDGITVNADNIDHITQQKDTTRGGEYYSILQMPSGVVCVMETPHKIRAAIDAQAKPAPVVSADAPTKQAEGETP